MIDAADINAGNIVEFIGDILERRGGDVYLGESVTMAQHMLQTASNVEQAGASEAVVVAGLLHDIGHFTSEFGTFSMGDTKDRYHELSGAAIVERFFPAVVTACVRSHVAAKRYLCATRADYFDSLSDASVHSLRLQGGPMEAAEVVEFETNRWLIEILQVRLADDAGKQPDCPTRPYSYFAPMVRRVANSASG